MPAYLSWVNLADTATITAIDPYTGIAAVMQRPLTELAVPFAKGLCRGPSNGSGTVLNPTKLKLRADLGSTLGFHCIGVVGLNIPAGVGGSMAVRISDVALGDSELENTTVYFTQDYSNGSEASAFWWFAPSFTFTGRYIELEIRIVGQPSGQRYVDARRLLIMTGGGSLLGFDSGWSIFRDNPTIDTQTDQGGVFITEKEESRVLRFSMSGRSEAEMKTAIRSEAAGYDNLELVLAKAGKRKEVVACPRDYTDDARKHKNTLYGRITEWSPIVHDGGDYYSCDGITVKEIPHPPL